MQIAPCLQYSSRWSVPCMTTTHLSIVNGHKKSRIDELMAWNYAKTV